MATIHYTHTWVQALNQIDSAQQGDFGVGLPVPALLLLLGLAFLAGFAGGITVEQVNLRLRERRLAQGRRLLAAQMRGLRQQLEEYYQLRSQSGLEQATWPELPTVNVDGHGT